MSDLQRVEQERQQALLDGQMMSRWKKQLERLYSERRRVEEQRDQMEKWWREEQLDVERLTSWSLSNLFYTLTGQKKSRLSKEDEEALYAKEQYEQSVAEVKSIEEQIKQLNAKLHSVGSWKARLEQAEERKEQLIRQHSPEAAQELDALTKERIELLNERKELDEAIRAGRNALQCLQRAEEKFVSADSWSTYDLLGGGMIATHMKHSRYDDAQSEVSAANVSIRAFQRELQDVKTLMKSTELVHIGDGLKLADYLFDGLIADWLVKGRIDDSLAAVRNGQSQITNVVRKLEDAKGEVDQCLNVLERRYDDILLEW